MFSNMFTVNDKSSSMIPSAMAWLKLAFRVSRTIDVVSTRVLHWMSPPTIMTAPTSAIALPNPASTATTIAWRASLSTMAAVCSRSAPSDTAVSMTDMSTDFVAVMVRPVRIGRIRHTWAMTIAAGVNSRPNSPRGPALDSTRNTKRPATTGGRPMSVKMRFFIKPLSGNSLSVMKVPSGMPMTAAISVATPETFRDRDAMSMISGLRPMIRSTAWTMPSMIYPNSDTPPAK